MSRPRQMVLALLLAVVVAGPSAAPAGALVRPTCPGAATQPFLRWADPLHYVLADAGDVGSGAPGWTLTGAAAPLYAPASADLAATGDDHVLRLGAGSSATSAPACVSLLSPVMRFMVRSTGSPLGVLAVTAVVRGGDGLLERLPLGVVTGLGSQWRPSLPMLLTPTLLPNLGDDLSEVRFRFTPIGLGARFEIDDVFVDPYRKG